MFWKKSGASTTSIEWQPLEELEQLHTLVEESHEQHVLIYKHSTRCGISGMALNRLERGWKEELNEVKTYFLDLISYRNLSNEIAQRFEVYHESPQIILVKNGKAIHNDSHMNISAESIEQVIQQSK